MKQTARIISTYSADVMGVCSALFELGGMTIMHDASGCNSTYTTHDEPRWFDMDSMVYISGISEIEAIMGDDEKLINDIVDAAEKLKPAFIAIAGTPIPTMTGFDFEAVASVIEQRTGIPGFGFPTTGMNTYIYGASMALAGIAERFVDEPETNDTESNTLQMSPRKLMSVLDSCCMRPNGIKVNILGLTPLDFSINGQDESIVQWLENEGFEVISRWAMGSSLDEIRRSAEADVDLVVSAAGLGVAEVLWRRFGIPYAVGMPIGDELSFVLADTLKDLAADNSEKSITVSRDVSRESFADPADEEAPAKGQVIIIGEGVTSLALATAIEFETGRNTKVLCATEPLCAVLREKDRVTPDEDDIIPELEDAAFVIADPMYKPIVPESAEFISLPSEAFSGRIYREQIPDLIGDPDAILKQLSI